MSWEATSLDLLEAAGIRTPRRRLVRVGERSALILRRFDRADTGRRVGYLSAVSVSDGDDRDYVDIAQAVRELSRSPKADHHELFRRVIASVALGNTDDHLRNHGFLDDHGSWALSPVFDVNPNPDIGATRSTSIAGADNLSEEPDALIDLAHECGLTPDQARARIRAVIGPFATWRDHARSNGVRERDITMMAGAIDVRVAALASVAGTS